MIPSFRQCFLPIKILFTFLLCTDKERAQISEYVESAVQPLIDLLRQPNVEDDIISSTCDEIYEKLDSGETITLFVPYIILTRQLTPDLLKKLIEVVFYRQLSCQHV